MQTAATGGHTSLSRKGEPLSDGRSARRQATKRASSGPRADAQAIVFCVTALWLVAVLVGTLLHSDLSNTDLRTVRSQLPLVWFDDVLKSCGAVLPIVPLAIRWWGNALARAKRNVRPPAHFAEALCIYAGLTAARFMVYYLHVLGVLHWLGAPLLRGTEAEGKKGHLMSDHLLLGASLVAMLTTETVLAAAELRNYLAKRSSDVFRLTCIVAALAASASIGVATIGDMYYTARYFHDRMETFGAVLLGSCLFQGPLGYWLLRGR